MKALRIALAAGFQNKLWEVVGLFYENQGEENSGWVTDELIDEILAEVPGLDAAKVKADADERRRDRSRSTAAQAEATTLEGAGTPWFFIGIGDQAAVPDRAQVARRRASSARPSTTPSSRDDATRTSRVGALARRRRRSASRIAAGDRRAAAAPRSSTGSRSAASVHGPSRSAW